MYHIEWVVTLECCGGVLGGEVVFCDDYFENGCKRGQRESRWLFCSSTCMENLIMVKNSHILVILVKVEST